MTFSSKLARAQEVTSSVVCVGLDPDPTRLPDQLQGLPADEAVRHFCTAIVEATQDVACAYKPNLAFFEALGRNGMGVLADVIAAVPHDRVVIADGKRGDIGNTADRYALSMFDILNCDACTVTPYMGRDAVRPFLTRAGKAAFALVRTSNPSAAEVQQLNVDGVPLFLRMADLLVDWAEGEPGEIGFVVGANDVDVLSQLRSRHPDIPFLIPGVGAQGGDPESVIGAAAGEAGQILVNASRSIIYAGQGSDFADRAREEAIRLRDRLTTESSGQ